VLAFIVAPSKNTRNFPMVKFSELSKHTHYKVLLVAGIGAVAISVGLIAFFYFSGSTIVERAPATDEEELTRTTDLKDKLGIEMLYATRHEGREWFMDMNYPNADDVFEARDQTIKHMDDGYWYAEGLPPNYQTRIMIESPAGTDLWKNVEMTGYFRVMKTYQNAVVAGTGMNDSGADAIEESADAIQAYARGGIHSNQLMKGSDGKEQYLNCVGSAYKGKFYFNGDASVAKEIGHPIYAAERFKQAELLGNNASAWTHTGNGLFEPLVQGFEPNPDGHNIPSRWVGLKVVIYDFIEKDLEYAKIQTYIDDEADDGSGRLTPSNNWKLLADVVDKGDWVADPKPKSFIIDNSALSGSSNANVNTLDQLIARCGNPFPTREDYSHMIISWLGHPDFIDDPVYRPIANAASFRWDHAGVEFAYLSVREIGGPR
jgi:hypothetical protein